MRKKGKEFNIRIVNVLAVVFTVASLFNESFIVPAVFFILLGLLCRGIF